MMLLLDAEVEGLPRSEELVLELFLSLAD